MIALFWLMACTEPVCVASGTGLQTTWQARWRAPTCDAALQDDLAAVVAGVEERLGLWSSSSELHRIRDGAGPVEVSEETFALVRLATDIAGASGGAFDPTIEPVVRAWGLAEDEPRVPDEALLLGAVGAVGYQRIVLERVDGVPRIDGHETSLDLGSLLEGHAADRMARLLATRGLGDHLVTVGSERRASGSGPQGPWRVGLDVAPGDRGALDVFRLGGGGMASAGSGRFTVDGVAYSKVFDARTGQPRESDVELAVVFAPTAVEADALATAWIALGAVPGVKLLEERPDVEGRAWIDEGVLETSGFRAFQP